MRTALVAIPLAALAATGCASAEAKSPGGPPLNVPPPPPHVVELAAEPMEPVGEIPIGPGGAAPGRQGRPASRDVPPKPEPPKTPEAKPDAPAPEPQPVAQPPAAPAAGLQLRTPQTADTGTAAKHARHRQLRSAQQRAQEGLQRREAVHPAGRGRAEGRQSDVRAGRGAESRNAGPRTRRPLSTPESTEPTSPWLTADCGHS
jgi:hypothetical protein